MSCIGAIRAHINALSRDVIITTRELLEYGYRSTVDQSISRLVRDEVLRRVARGVFVKFDAPDPTALEVARTKAEAFGKTLVTDGQKIACELRLAIEEGEPQIVYQVNGKTSSFKFLGVRITLRGAVPKKSVGAESSVARTIRALLHLGSKMESTQLLFALRQLEPTDLYKMVRSSRWMPHWLADEVREMIALQMRSKTGVRATAS